VAPHRLVVCASHNPGKDLVGELAAKPVKPVPVNCATAPLPIADFGAAVGQFLDSIDQRVLLIGTDGLSHSPPSLEVDTYELDHDERARIIAEGMVDARKNTAEVGW
jgi:2,3-dihydroxyphenylpropionate 1,2-dioxygenase